MIQSRKIYLSEHYAFGFRPGSFDKKPKINNETKKLMIVYTKILSVNI